MLPHEVAPRPARGFTFGLAAAALFGASTPVAKVLVPGSGPLFLAGLLYLGAGLGLTLAAPFRRRDREAPLRRSDLPVLAAVMVAGGIVGPALLVSGLGRLAAAPASLLLNLETPFTIALAVALLGERLSRIEGLGVAGVVAGAIVLTWSPGALGIEPLGAGLVAGACAAWAVDNALSAKLADRDPVAVARAKTLAAGAVNLGLAWLLGEPGPSPAYLGGALITGALGYGLSIVFHLLAVRQVGAARQAAVFGTAPFVGALLAIPILGERLTAAQLAAGSLMAAGVVLVARARHGHPHDHTAVEHEHSHVHDEHHDHRHADPLPGSHSHVHQHAPLLHDHPHTQDLHHRHGH